MALLRRFTLKQALGCITILFVDAILLRFVIQPPILSTGLKEAGLCAVVIVLVLAVTAGGWERGLARFTIVAGLTNFGLTLAIVSSPMGHYVLRVPPQITIAAFAATWAFLGGFLAWIAVVLKQRMSASASPRRFSWGAVAGWVLFTVVQIPSIFVFCLGTLIDGEKSEFAVARRKLDEGVGDRLAQHLRAVGGGPAEVERLLASGVVDLNNDTLRREIVARINSRNEPSDLSVLLRLLQHPNESVRSAARYGIMAARITDVATLIDLAGVDDREVKLRAIYELRFHARDGQAAVPVLEQIVAEADRTGDKQLRDAAESTLRQLAPKTRKP